MNSIIKSYAYRHNICRMLTINVDIHKSMNHAIWEEFPCEEKKNKSAKDID